MSLEKKDLQQAYLARITNNLNQAEEELKIAEAKLLQSKAVKERASRELADYEQLRVNI